MLTLLTDLEIATAARTALEQHPLIDDKRLTLAVSNGVVTIAGTARSELQREDAVRVIGLLAGVRGVTDLIAIDESRSGHRAGISHAPAHGR